MSFSNPTQHIFSNKEEQEQKLALEQEHASLKLRIKEGKQQVAKIVDLSDDIEKHTRLLGEVRKKKELADKEHQVILNNLDLTNNQLEKSNKELGVVLDTHKATQAKVSLAELYLENLGKTIKLAEKDRDDTATQVIEQKEELEREQEKHANLVAKSSLLQTQLSQANAILETLSLQIDELEQHKSVNSNEYNDALEALDKVNKTIKDKEAEIVATDESNQIKLQEADKKSQDIISSAQEQIEKRHQDLNNREGAISVREKWNKTKENKLKEIKNTLEEHLGQSVNIVFPE